MKIVMRTIMAGPGGCVDAGVATDVPEDLAADLVSGGFADYASAPDPAPAVVALDEGPGAALDAAVAAAALPPASAPEPRPRRRRGA